MFGTTTELQYNIHYRGNPFVWDNHRITVQHSLQGKSICLGQPQNYSTTITTGEVHLFGTTTELQYNIHDRGNPFVWDNHRITVQHSLQGKSICLGQPQNYSTTFTTGEIHLFGTTTELQYNIHDRGKSISLGQPQSYSTTFTTGEIHLFETTTELQYNIHYRGNLFVWDNHRITVQQSLQGKSICLGQPQNYSTTFTTGEIYLFGTTTELQYNNHYRGSPFVWDNHRITVQHSRQGKSICLGQPHNYSTTFTTGEIHLFGTTTELQYNIHYRGSPFVWDNHRITVQHSRQGKSVCLGQPQNYSTTFTTGEIHFFGTTTELQYNNHYRGILFGTTTEYPICFCMNYINNIPSPWAQKVIHSLHFFFALNFNSSLHTHYWVLLVPSKYPSTARHLGVIGSSDHRCQTMEVEWETGLDWSALGGKNTELHWNSTMEITPALWKRIKWIDRFYDWNYIKSLPRIYSWKWGAFDPTWRDRVL